MKVGLHSHFIPLPYKRRGGGGDIGIGKHKGRRLPTPYFVLLEVTDNDCVIGMVCLLKWKGTGALGTHQYYDLMARKWYSKRRRLPRHTLHGSPLLVSYAP